MKLIPLTRGYSAIVDDDDFDWLSQWKWHSRIDGKNVYAARNATLEDGSRATIRMHRQILDLSDPRVLADHADGNGLNNQRTNLRSCTHRQNTMNRGSVSGSISRFKGVSWHHTKKKWFSQIRVSGKNKNLGYFDNDEEAARVYNYFAKEYNGEFARYNNVSPLFPDIKWTPTVLVSRNNSGFRGVSAYPRGNMWVCQIVIKGKPIYLGLFKDAAEAAREYDRAAYKAHGESARLNFPNEIDVTDSNGAAFGEAARTFGEDLKE